jgi:hypothetical protein
MSEKNKSNGFSADDIYLIYLRALMRFVIRPFWMNEKNKRCGCGTIGIFPHSFGACFFTFFKQLAKFITFGFAVLAGK